MKGEGIASLRNLDDDLLVVPHTLVVLVETEAKLPHVHTYRTVVCGMEVLRLIKDSKPDSLLRQSCPMTAKSTGGQIAQ
jgi:hypothetical protein